MLSSRFLSAAVGLFMLSGCAMDLGFGSSEPRASASVVGDEPYAVKGAVSVFSQGGNAADAATAMYFALAVTYPVAAGLGGGGICIVHDPASGTNEEFDFLARNPAGGGPYAVPGNVRGFALMHTAYGALPWQRVISPAEGYAAAGFPISRALATRLRAAEDIIRLDAGLAAEFMDESGHAKAAGTIVANRELADTLAAIRTQGADALYTGAVARRIAGYSAAQGGAISADDLAGYPQGRTLPRAVQLGSQYVFLPGERTGAGAFAGALFDNLVRAQSAANGGRTTEEEVVEATKQTLNAFGISNLPTDLGATGFVTTDNSGQAVACAVTMNGPFGSGHTAEGTGVVLARAPASSDTGVAAAFLTPVIATNNDGQLVLAGAGAGGPVGTASIADAIARLGKGEGIGRRADAGAAGVTLYDTVNAIVCRDGNCTALPDASANGLGAVPVQ